jgi:uncharacterized protein YjiS (DUF1127 family)
VNSTENAWFGTSGRATSQPNGRLRLTLRLRNGLDRATNWVARRRSRRGAATLLAFSDRELWDLGLSRSDIPGIIDGTYRRD